MPKLPMITPFAIARATEPGGRGAARASSRPARRGSLTPTPPAPAPTPTPTPVFAEALVAMPQWTFLLGPGLIPGINALFLG